MRIFACEVHTNDEEDTEGNWTLVLIADSNFSSLYILNGGTWEEHEHFTELVVAYGCAFCRQKAVCDDNNLTKNPNFLEYCDTGE